MTRFHDLDALRSFAMLLGASYAALQDALAPGVDVLEPRLARGR